MKIFIQGTALLLLFSCFSVQVAAQSCGSNWNNNQLLIAFSPTIPRDTIDSLRRVFHVQFVDSLQCAPRFYRWTIPRDSFPVNLDGTTILTIQSANEAIKGRPSSLSCDGNLETEIIRDVDASTMCSYSAPIGNISGATLRKLGIIDSGIDITGHSMLFLPYLTTGLDYDYVSPIPVARLPIDSNGHGTHVAGLAAQMFKDYNVNARIAIFKTQDKDGFGDLWTLGQAIDRAVCNGIEVVNISIGYQNCRYYDARDQKDFIAVLMNYARQEYGTLFVVAAGNSSVDMSSTSTNRHCPASYSSFLPNVISVGAVDCGNNWASFSNYHPDFTQMSALGVNVQSTWLTGMMRTKSGTSQASPQVAATATALGTLNTTFSTTKVKNALLNGASKLPSLTSKVLTGNVLNIMGSYINFLGALPVDLQYFTAHKKNEYVVLTWKTSAEIDVDKFEIQYSTDGKTWSDIGSIQAKGNGQKEAFYDFEHLINPQMPPILYYRLTILDKNGTSRYSPIATVNVSERLTFALFPNPAHFTEGSYLSVNNAPQSATLTVNVVDMLGRLVWSQTLDTAAKSPYHLDWTQAHLSAGLYTIAVSNRQNVLFNARFVIK